MDPQLFALVRGYACLVPPADLCFPTSPSLSALMDALVAHLLESEHFKHYGPSAQYQKVFWKWAIAQLETSLSQTDEVSLHCWFLPSVSVNSPSHAGHRDE
ncbi:hypothetical protein BD626DRAFT_192810 [Schizophyllum amplum]|uniref:Uncharacterized protein n=1 Tax=Schizophyllum amplum TaxID=97359 RepID=A0A550CM43_9AGAR|nr:hypothetical protein BD626DRAFT_192810 [Auriculariopsis ampla]